MSYQPGTTFQTNGVGDQNSSAMTAATTIETYVTTVTTQATFGTLQDVPDLQAHQTTSKTNAQSWINTVRENLYQNNADLLAFGTKFNTFYANLLALANDINNPTSRTNFATGVQLLLQDVDTYATNAQNTVNVLSNWSGLLATDSSNFQGDLTKVQSVYEGDQGLLTSLKNEIASDTTAMARDISLIAGGVITDIVGGLIIACGVLLEIPSGGAATGIVVTGVAFEVAGSSMIGTAAHDYSLKSSDKASATQKLANLKAEIALTHSLGDTLTSLGSSCSNALAAANLMVKTWQVLQTNFQTTHTQISDLSATIPQAWLIAELETSLADWKAVIATATTIQQQLEGIPVQNNTGQEYLGSSAATLSARPAATNRQLQTAVPIGVRQILLNVDSTGAIVQLLIDAIKLLKVDIAGLSSTKLNPLWEGATAEAKKAAAVLRNLEEHGTAFATYLLDSVKPPLNASKVSKLFADTVRQLAEIQERIKDLEQGALSLGKSAATIVTTSGAKADSLTLEGGNERVKSWTKEIQNLSFQLSSSSIATSDSILVPWLPATIKPGFAKVYAKDQSLREKRAAEVAKLPIGSEFRDLEARLRLAKSFSYVVQSYTSHVYQLDTVFRALNLSLKSVVLPGVTDDLVELWVQAQAKELIDALNGLVGTSEPAPRGTLPRVSAYPTVAIPITEGLGETALPSTLDTLTAISTATVNISAAAAILTQQPNIQLQDVDQFAEQFQLARDHSKQFQASYVSDLLAPLGQASSLGTFIVQALQTIKNFTNTGDYPSAIPGVQIIQSHIQDTISLNQVSRQNLAIFLQAILDDKSRFVVLEASVPRALNEGITKLTQDAKDLQAKIEAANQKIAEGATKTVLLVLGLEAAIAVAIGLSFVGIPVAEGAGELTVLAVKAVNAGIQTASSTAKGKAQATLLNEIGGDDTLDQQAKNIAALRSTLVELAQEQASLAVFNTTDTQVQQIASAVTAGVAQLDALNKALQRDLQDFNVLTTELQASQTTSLAATLAKWQAIQTGASQLLNSYANLSTN